MRIVGLILVCCLTMILSLSGEARSPRGSVTPSGIGVWVNVTPPGIDLIDPLSCSNFGVETVISDTSNPGTFYTHFDCQGVWKSTDYGQTWTLVSTGTNSTTANDCAGGINLVPNATPGGIATVYQACIRGNGLGFWISTNGGVDWTFEDGIAMLQGMYPPAVDPYNGAHILTAGHEVNYLQESFDGGATWASITLASGMMTSGGTAFINIINTGNSTTTAKTWLWMAQDSGGAFGTWRTTDEGVTWTQVDKTEHPHGSSQIYQPDTSGILFIAGQESVLGDGVLRSTDYGVTFAHVGNNTPMDSVIGTSKNMYAMYGLPLGPGVPVAPAFQFDALPGTGTWTAPGTPAGMTQGNALFATQNDGTHNIVLSANWNAGLWRYIEP